MYYDDDDDYEDDYGTGNNQGGGSVPNHNYVAFVSLEMFCGCDNDVDC